MAEDNKISETDWKRWVHLSADALARFQESALTQAAKTAKVPGSADERYRKLSKILAQADEVIADVFDDQKRPRAALQIAAALKAGVITEAELEEFSQESHEAIARARNPAT